MTAHVFQSLFAAVAVVLCFFPVSVRAAEPGPGGLSGDEWAARIRAGWVGKVAAGSGALPTEMWSREAIRAKYGVLVAPPQTPTSRGPLDDTTLAFLGWQTIRRQGPGFTTADIAAEWVRGLSDADLQGGGFGREFRESLQRLRRGEAPPLATGTPRAEWIASQMRAEVWGMLAPGDPARAADYAERDARVFNVGNGVYAARFTAALASVLMVDPDIPRAIDTARGVIPADCVLAELVAWTGTPCDGWEAAWDAFVAKYRDRSMAQRLSAWCPGWVIETGGWPDAAVLDEYLGRRNVLRSHPFGAAEPAVLSAVVDVPPDGGALTFGVSCNDRPADVDWLLRVCIDGEAVRSETIRHRDGGARWYDIRVDLAPWAGKRVTLALENGVAGKFGWEAGFWTPPAIADSRGDSIPAAPPGGLSHRYPLEFSPMILPETFAVLTGLRYGDGDFGKSVSIATMCGFDTDCNAGTVGCLLGIRNGLDGIPAEWRDPVGDLYELQVSGLPRQWRISELATAMAETGAHAASAVRGAVPQPAPVVPEGARQGASAPATPTGLPPDGFGAGARGGEEGRVIVVTTTADGGAGSLREALAASGARVIQFACEGTIELASRLRCTSGRVTVDGSSAPGDGITLLNHGIQFRGDCDDIIVRDLRIRVTTGGTEGDCILLWGTDGGTVERVLIEHCSLMGATDEIVNTWGNVRDVTVRWCIIAEARPPHSKAWLSGQGSDRISIHHCLFANCADRVPKLEGGTYDVVNNVMVNWGVNNAAKIGLGATVNLVGNCFLPGPDSDASAGCVFPVDPDKGTQVHLSGNIGPFTPDATGDPWANVTYCEKVGTRWVSRRPAPAVFRADRPFPVAPVETQPAREALESVLSRAGARTRDAADLRVLQAARAAAR